MKVMKTDFQNLIFLLILIIIICYQTTSAQALGASGKLKWLCVNSLQTYFSEQGSEVETGGTDELGILFSWPAEYGHRQRSMRARGMMIGCTDFYSALTETTYPYMVTNVGPKPTEYTDGRPIFDAFDFRLIGKYNHPKVYVDAIIGTNQLSIYDSLNAVDPAIPSERMLIVKNHSIMGITITKKVYAFTRKRYDNYYIYEYVFTNTGIIDEEGTVYSQTLDNFYVYFAYRYTLAGESVRSYQNRWGVWNSAWGRNTVNDVIGTDPAAAEFNDPTSILYHIRANLAWYGPHSERDIELEADWGCPNEDGNGIMASARYVGCATLHADTSPQDNTDDLSQPSTTHFIDADDDALKRAGSWYNEEYMEDRYSKMIMGHAERTHAEEIELSGTPANEWWTGEETIGGYVSVQGYGPYTLAPGDSIRIVLTQGVAGLSREKNRDIGTRWLQWYNGTGNPTLIRSNGEATTDYNLYKKEWVWTCKDSLIKTFRNAMANFKSGYNFSQPPPPPDEFNVTSGSSFIRLTWSDNATTWPNFDGYVIYRAKDYVMAPEAVYEKIFECNAFNVVHQYNDMTAYSGHDYYYYIQTKDDGSTNEMEPGVPLTSSMFWTLTNIPAYSGIPEKIEQSAQTIPYSFRLDQNYPNPFNPSTTVRFILPESGNITLKVYDLSGRELETVFQGSCRVGENKIEWNSKNRASGIYIYRLEAGKFIATKKMILLK